MKRVLISGASGLIGSALIRSFARPMVGSSSVGSASARSSSGGSAVEPTEQAETEIVRLVRGPAQGEREISWNPTGELAPAAVSGFDAVIHLAGESVVGRWTNKKKSAIRDSRVLSTRSIAAAIGQAQIKPRVFVCGSAIGFYGNRDDEVLTEESASGNGFLAEVSREWEAASRIASEAGIRTANLRTGLVLSAQGGALTKMLPVFKLGLGGRLGSGRQWMSWIHIDDMVGAIHHIMKSDSVTGPVNMVGPNPVRNAEFTRVLAAVVRRPAGFPVPEFALALAFGTNAARELFLASARVEPARLLSSGYTFRFSDLRAALTDLV